MSEYFSTDISPEELLWKSVILSFFHDAQRDRFMFNKATNSSQKKKYFDRLTAHLRLSTTEHIQTCCFLSKTNPEEFVLKLEGICNGICEIYIPRSDLFKK